jgi:hypothetical protein
MTRMSLTQFVRQFVSGVLRMPVPRSPARLNQDRRRAMLVHLIEELSEFSTAMSLADEADALVDLAWVAVRGLVEMGVDPDAAIREVARANLSKVPGSNPKRPGDAHDAVKPPGWAPPDWDKVLGAPPPTTPDSHGFSGLTNADVRDFHLPTGRTHDLDEKSQVVWDAKLKAEFTLPSGPVNPAPLRYSVQPTPGDFDGDERSSGGGKFMKHDDGKDCRPELIPAPFLWELGKLYARGALKYAAENWRKCRDPQRYVGAAERHFLEWRMGERVDPETGVHHLVCAAWNLVALFVGEVECPSEQAAGPDQATRYRR